MTCACEVGLPDSHSACTIGEPSLPVTLMSANTYPLRSPTSSSGSSWWERHGPPRYPGSCACPEKSGISMLTQASSPWADATLVRVEVVGFMAFLASL